MGKKKVVTKTDSTASEGAENTASVGASKKSTKKQVLNGIANINVSYNNTLISISDLSGEIIAWSSSGSMGFKGTRKSTPHAAN